MMTQKTSFAVDLEDDTHVCVKYEIIETADAYRPYGLRAVLRDADGQVLEAQASENRFATAEEAGKIAAMFCDYTVFPCTLTDCLLS